MLRSCRMPNAPHVVWSAGIGLALFHFALTYSAKSLQGLYWSSRSNAIGCSGVIATVEPGAGADAVCAGAGAEVDAAGAEAFWFWLLLQPETASAAPMASAIGVNKCLCIGCVLWCCETGCGALHARARATDCASNRQAWSGPLSKVMPFPLLCVRPVRLHTAATFGSREVIMDIVFHGAAGEVTGSCHLVEVAGKRVLLDCGMVQGERQGGPSRPQGERQGGPSRPQGERQGGPSGPQGERQGGPSRPQGERQGGPSGPQGERQADERNAADFPFDPESIDVLVLSHAHIDHTGRVPLLVKRGFAGPIFTHPATIDLADIMLSDCAHIAQMDAEQDNRHLQPGQKPSVPLYTQDDVDDATKLMRPVEYGAPLEILPGVRLTLRDAGHILGSATVEIDAEEKGAARKLVFTGDLGPDHTPILCDPAPVPAADLVVMESTYGDRLHKSREDTVAELASIFAAAHRDGGNVVIPAFAVGRTQELLYFFAEHFDAWGLGAFKLFLRSEE